MATAQLPAQDLNPWTEGNRYRTYELLGAHLAEQDGAAGVRFAVWAPNARAVSVVGDFNGWDPRANPLELLPSGVWSGFVLGAAAGARYQYRIVSRQGSPMDKADPYGYAMDPPPGTASRVWDLAGYAWGDRDWLARRGRALALDAPVTIYEVHLGSWRRVPEEDNRRLSYRELAPLLADYAHDMGYTHVEFLPVAEHPFAGSWGYQGTGLFAPTARHGTPDDFMFLVDTLHRRGLGVILDWVPAHFARDAHGLGLFDGTHLFEYEDPQKGEHKEWGTYIFDFGRREVRSFLISNALFWLDRYHIDALRVDAVASMLYLDFGRKPGEWRPNAQGGRENLEAVDFLRRCNEEVYRRYPDVQTIAEESSAWPKVSRPTSQGGLGFGYKWDMGWMHDTLKYLAVDPARRKEHHNHLTFRMMYAFNENYILPLSHDDVVYGKKSLVSKMPGDDWRRFANLRLLLGYMFAQPGKKLLFMGGEFGQWQEWNHDVSLDWHLLGQPLHQGVQRWVRDLNTFYRGQPAFHQLDCDPAGFEWIEPNDAERSVYSFLRKGRTPGDVAVVVCNFTPEPRQNYRVGVPLGGAWEEVLNSDAPLYGGSGQGNMGGVTAAPVPWNGRSYLLSVTVPPLGMVVFRRKPAGKMAGR